MELWDFNKFRTIGIGFIRFKDFQPYFYDCDFSLLFACSVLIF